MFVLFNVGHGGMIAEAMPGALHGGNDGMINRYLSLLVWHGQRMLARLKFAEPA
ncbi:hypothetical protein OX462_18080 [Janthinobacterium sp. SUN098]|uniref:hypothetical protein n=1 Tax=Janthinobacterium sp. SUN098 TaxID=3002437 RepID=UPI0038D3FC35